ncbi:hypothetical protein [Thermoplasma volcanium]|nr:hypothetical protein [Thermoplasma volcanium]
MDNMDMEYPIIEDLLHQYSSFHLLLSDGIVIDEDKINDGARIQRILTVHQLVRILVDQDEDPYIILIRHDVVNGWNNEDIENLYDVMRIKSYYRNCDIYFVVLGGTNIFNFMMLGGFYGKEHTEYETEPL